MRHSRAVTIPDMRIDSRIVKLVVKSLVAGAVIQGFLLLLMFITGAILPDNEIRDGLQFIIVSFMPAILFMVKHTYEGADHLALFSCIDVLVYASMIFGFLWWRQKRREAGEAERRALRIT